MLNMLNSNVYHPLTIRLLGLNLIRMVVTFYQS